MMLLLWACSSAPPPAEPVVRTDRARLEEMIVLPDGFGPPRWVVQPLGTPSMVPGPTDYLLVVYLPVPDPAALDRLGPAKGRQSGELDDRWARELLPTPQLLRRESGKATVKGPSYPATTFERMPWHAQKAIGLQESTTTVGLLVWLQTM